MKGYDASEREPQEYCSKRTLTITCSPSLAEPRSAVDVEVVGQGLSASEGLLLEIARDDGGQTYSQQLTLRNGRTSAKIDTSQFTLGTYLAIVSSPSHGLESW